MNYETDSSCLDRLQREALTCLNGFPNKVSALNDIIATYAPEVTKKSLESVGIPLNQESAANESSSENLSAACSLASASNLERRVSGQRISKKKHNREGRWDQRVIRCRPGPLAHILTFLSNSIAVCTKATVIRPSRYIANRALTMLRDILIQRGELIHVQCGPNSTILALPESAGRASLIDLKIDLGTSVKNCIGIMRPAVAQLIADTTKLKRWLQALAVNFSPPTTPLIYAIRKTEAIDGWAYELFFHLKYLQENSIRNVEKKAVMGFKVSDELRNTNLWHRLVQLRDNYLFLYDTLYSNDQYCKFSRGSIESIEIIK